MPTLRDIIDGTTITAAAPVAMRPSPVAQQIQPKPATGSPFQTKTVKAPTGKASPIAQHVSNHMQDPVGSTKEGFEGLQQAKLQYDQQRETMQRNLAPVQSVINHVSQMHNLQPNQDQMTQDPNNPGMTGQPGQPGMGGPNEDEQEAYDENGNPINMGQTVGKMNQSRPSMAGHQPGVAPGDGQTVRPPKMGMTTPGGKPAQNSMQPKSAGGQQYNPAAKPPKGNRSLPGAKGPGDPKVANRTKKAQDQSSSRGIKVEVHAIGSIEASSATFHNLESSIGLGMLKTPSRIKALASGLGDKSSEPGTELSYNPVMRSKGKKVAKMRTGKMTMCKACGQMHAEGKCMKAAGTSKGAKHRAATIGQKHLSPKEKKAHWEGMDAGGPGSGRRPGGSKKQKDFEDRAKKMGLPSAVPGSQGRDKQGNIIPQDKNTGRRL